MLTISKLSDSPRFVPLSLLLALLITISVPKAGLASKEARDPDRATLLVLDDCDDDNKRSTPPHGDTVLLLNSEGQLIRKIRGLTVDGSVVGCRAISVSEDGRFFSVLENAFNRISVYDASTGAKLWSLAGFFRSAVFAEGLVYALGHGGAYAIDNTGTIVKHSRTGGGLDIVFDPLAKCLWIVGMDIKKYSLDLKLQFKVKLSFGISPHAHGAAFSVDVNPDGSVWVACRDGYGKESNANRLMKISPMKPTVRSRPRTMMAWWPPEWPPVCRTDTPGISSLSPATASGRANGSASRSSSWSYDALRRGLLPIAKSHSCAWATMRARGNAGPPAASTNPPAWSKCRWLSATKSTVPGSKPAARNDVRMGSPRTPRRSLWWSSMRSPIPVSTSTRPPGVCT